LPTPNKFHYVFNLRDVSRIFKGLCQIDVPTIKNAVSFSKGTMTPEVFLIALWRHECERVFVDKLIDQKEKDDVLKDIKECSHQNFSEKTKEISEMIDSRKIYFCDFLHEDTMDEDGATVLEEAPKIYEGIDDITRLRQRCLQLLGNFNANPKFSNKKMDLVLFDDALSHLIRISRIIQMPRSSGLLVGVGGSGKQSLTRLAAYAGRQDIKQILLTKGFNENGLKDFIKDLFDEAGHKDKKVTFIMTDAEVKDENFLEYINMVLSTGEIPGLLQKDEKEVWLGDVRTVYQKKKKSKDEPTQQVIYEYFLDRLRDNLHIMLCFSPVGTKFRDRARKFPALFGECSIDWFLPWPTDALCSVAKQQIENFPKLKTRKEIKEKDLPDWMSNLH
jgi:dynein heavy chain, axonemal